MNKGLTETICTRYNLHRLPEAISFIEDDRVTLKLDTSKIMEDNMQDGGNAFEGWAIVAHICSGYKDVILDVNEDKDYCLLDYKGKYVKHGHWCRFLYRAKRFSEQYTWFKLSDEHKLEDIANDFVGFLEKNTFINNVPTKEAEETDRITDENNVEAKLAEGSKLQDILKNTVNLDIGSGQVHRQLPVGLFKEKKERDTAIFTNGHSAIDLWNRNDNTINVVELKTHNRMIGIITEIFFYSNYMLDLVSENGLFEIAKGGTERGYNELEKGLKNVNGILLADDDKNGGFYPCVDDEVIMILKENGKDNLDYYKANYHVTSSVEVTKPS